MGIRFIQQRHPGAGLLHSAVGGEEFAAQVGHDGILIAHNHSRSFGDFSDHIGFQIFAGCFINEDINIFRCNDDGHAFLRFRYGQLRGVQALVFLSDKGKVDIQPVGQFAYGDRNTARAEIVAPFYHFRDAGVKEKTLDFAFLRCVALLDLRRHSDKGCVIVCF